MKSAAIVLLATLLGACADPVVDAEIAALPPDGRRNGPTHRGGQPCGLCHSSAGGRTPTFTVAGTVYQKPTNKVPIDGAIIHVTDATGASMDRTSNCAGNFYITDSEWQPVFPLHIDLSFPLTGDAIKMKSKIGRDASCAQCHADPAGTDTVGHVYLTADAGAPDMTPPPLNCGR